MRLDDDYANAAYIPNGSTYPDLWADLAQEFRSVEAACGRAWLNQAYDGDLAYDLFLPSPQPSGCMIFVHGGYWRTCDRKDWSHLATGVMAQDWACAVPSYPLCPDVSVPDITQSICAAIETIADQVPGPLTLAGHSAGGHLVTRMVMQDVGLSERVAERLVHVAAISPLADLRDFLETSMNAELGLTAETAVAESPALGAKHLPVDVSVWVGENERPKFLEQAEILAQAWGAAKTIVPNRHHFDVITELCDSSTALVDLLAGR
ncbi:MAG: alpha/beta hydrolase [Pseudomonadota bacterium]